MKHNLRTAYIAKDNDSNDISDNVRVRIHIENNIIPVNISQIYGKAKSRTENKTETDPKDIEYRLSVKSEFTEKRDDVDVKSSLYEEFTYVNDDGDEVTDNRYVYIGHALSILYNVYELFWFDRKYGDIIKIIELTALVDLSGDSNVITKTNDIRGEILSLRLKTDKFKDINIVKNSLDLVERNITIKNVKDISGIKTHLIKVKSNNAPYLEINNSGVMIDDEAYIEGSWGTITECYSLGSSENLFDQDNFKISAMRVHNDVSIKPSHYIYIGEHNLDDILIFR